MAFKRMVDWNLMNKLLNLFVRILFWYGRMVFWGWEIKWRYCHSDSTLEVGSNNFYLLKQFFNNLFNKKKKIFKNRSKMWRQQRNPLEILWIIQLACSCRPADRTGIINFNTKNWVVIFREKKYFIHIGMKSCHRFMIN